MLKAIRSFVSRNIIVPGEPAPGSGETAPAPDGAATVRIAACALLLELAHADGEFSEKEQEHIENALARHFGLDENTARELLQLAEQERAASIDHFQFTHLIAEHYDLGQKMVLAEVMWGVILADGELAAHETYLVRKLASLLELEPAYLARARKAASPDR